MKNETTFHAGLIVTASLQHRALQFTRYTHRRIVPNVTIETSADAALEIKITGLSVLWTARMVGGSDAAMARPLYAASARFVASRIHAIPRAVSADPVGSSNTCRPLVALPKFLVEAFSRPKLFRLSRSPRVSRAVGGPRRPNAARALCEERLF
ncbi:hypothetical protein [Sphingomonas sp. RIT328]|uniref:hypothetical protein n=1 Tax=Sphingomonas sp. RIT328 TaxID=1470591 RepID=UPI000684B6CA|nr:hypothetical protein [Sphingomonas sp. RIT328]